MFLRNFYNTIPYQMSTGATGSSDMTSFKAYAKDNASPPTSVVWGVSYNDKVGGLMQQFPKGTKSQFSGAGTRDRDALFIGVVFGTGNTEPTIDDYQMAGEHFVDYTVSHTYENTIDGTTRTLSCRYTLTSTSTESVTIGEVGLSIYAFRKSGSYRYYSGFLIERTALDSPITIPAGGVGIITYTLKFGLPNIQEGQPMTI